MNQDPLSSILRYYLLFFNLHNSLCTKFDSLLYAVDRLLSERRLCKLSGTTDQNGFFEANLFHRDYEMEISHPAMKNYTCSFNSRSLLITMSVLATPLKLQQSLWFSKFFLPLQFQRSHITQTITIPSDSLLNELRIVEVCSILSNPTSYCCIQIWRHAQVQQQSLTCSSPIYLLTNIFNS